MTWPASLVSDTVTVCFAVDVMDRSGFDHLLVRSGGDIATLCRHDVWRMSGKAPITSAVRAEPPIPADNDLRSAVERFATREVCCVPVLVVGRSPGVLTALDILAADRSARLPRCHGCGGHHRVHGLGPRFCVDCIEQMAPGELDDLYLDLGVGD